MKSKDGLKKKKKNLDKIPVILPKKRNPREANFIVIQTQSSTNQTHPKKKKKKNAILKCNNHFQTVLLNNAFNFFK